MEARLSPSLRSSSSAYAWGERGTTSNLGLGFDVSRRPPTGVSRPSCVVLPPEEAPHRQKALQRTTGLRGFFSLSDLVIALGRHPGELSENLIPASDGTGEVVAVGEDVSKWAVGDRVVGNLTQAQIARPYNTNEYFNTSLGGQALGMLAQYKVLPDYGLVRIPDHPSFEEAATLPSAALTAWNSLFGANNQAIGPGQAGVSPGTGGVSVWGAQLALLAGARVSITSSSDSKLETVLKHFGDYAGSQALKRVHMIIYKPPPPPRLREEGPRDRRTGSRPHPRGWRILNAEEVFPQHPTGRRNLPNGFVAGKADAQPNVAQLALMTAATLGASSSALESNSRISASL